MRRAALLAIGAAGLLAAPLPAHAAAITYGFGCISNNSAINCAAGEAQLSLIVSDDGLAGQVRFRFENSGPAASSIADVYFDDDLGLLSSIDSIASSAGVAFSTSASPPNLPAGASISPAFSADFLADSDPPVAPNGVNPGEFVALIFNLEAGKSYANVISAIEGADLRAGIHVQAFADGGSDSFVNNPAPVPEPGTMLLLGSGLVGLAARARSRRRG